MTKGRITVNRETGKWNVAESGKFDLTTEDASIGSCCCCQPYTLTTHTTSTTTAWNLSQYQGNGVATPKRYWRLTNQYTSYVPIRRGCVDKNGKLVGLPSSISATAYKYTWVFRLEIGCKVDSYIKFPSGYENASLYHCDW